MLIDTCELPDNRYGSLNHGALRPRFRSFPRSRSVRQVATTVPPCWAGRILPAASLSRPGLRCGSGPVAIGVTHRRARLASSPRIVEAPAKGREMARPYLGGLRYRYIGAAREIATTLWWERYASRSRVLLLSVIVEILPILERVRPYLSYPPHNTEVTAGKASADAAILRN